MEGVGSMLGEVGWGVGGGAKRALVSPTSGPRSMAPIYMWCERREKRVKSAWSERYLYLYDSKLTVKQQTYKFIY